MYCFLWTSLEISLTIKINQSIGKCLWAFTQEASGCSWGKPQIIKIIFILKERKIILISPRVVWLSRSPLDVSHRYGCFIGVIPTPVWDVTASCDIRAPPSPYNGAHKLCNQIKSAYDWIMNTSIIKIQVIKIQYLYIKMNIVQNKVKFKIT